MLIHRLPGIDFVPAKSLHLFTVVFSAISITQKMHRQGKIYTFQILDKQSHMNRKVIHCNIKKYIKLTEIDRRDNIIRCSVLCVTVAICIKFLFFL